MKKCSKCKQEKELSEFYYRHTKKIYESWCKECCKETVRNTYKNNIKDYRETCYKRAAKYKAENKQFVSEYVKTHHCVDCGESDPVVLQFDHREGTVKKNNVSNLVRYWHPDWVRREVEKCDIRCANCHIRKTAKKGKWHTK